jgi:hypothetical protein
MTPSFPRVSSVASFLPSFARSSRRSSLLSCASVAAAVLIGACAQDEADSESVTAEIALDAGDTGQSESSLLAAAFDGIGLGATAAALSPSDITALANARLAARFVPAGCATSTTTSSSLTVRFAGCTGPRGLRSVDGTLTLAITAVTPTSFTATATATDFQIGRATVDLDLKATYAATGSSYTLSVESNSTGVGPFGHQLDASGSYLATWDASCTSVNGSWSTALDGRAGSTQVDLRRCVDSCAVGTVTRTTRDGRVITMTLDGNTAAWSSSTGRSGTVLLRCGR